MNRLNAEVIDLDSSDEDLPRSQTIPPAYPTSSVSSETSIVCNSFLGLNRKAMEQERLARKRKASISPPPLRKSVKVAFIDRSHHEVPSTVIKNGPAKPLDRARSKLETKVLKSSFHPTTASEPTYLDAVVRKTWARGYDRHEDIKMEEIIQRKDLTMAVISSFQWDIDWLFSKLDIKSTRLTLIMHAKEESTRQQYKEDTSTMPNLRLCFPSMEGNVSCMHSKFMLLGHPSHLRIMVTTANMTPHDWGESGVMENMVFLIDLPRCSPNHTKQNTNQMTSFGRELIYFLEAMGLDAKIIQSILNFDFSRTEDLAFVHSIGGVHVGEEARSRTGFCGLGTAIRELGLANKATLAIDYVTSSMGSLNINFLMILYMAAQGDNGLTEYNWREGISKLSQNKGNDEQQAEKKVLDMMQDTTRENFRVYFPTYETVVASNGGTGCGGTICFSGKCFAYPQFPRGVLRDCSSQRTGLVMHNKVGRLLPCRFPRSPFQIGILLSYSFPTFPIDFFSPHSFAFYSSLTSSLPKLIYVHPIENLADSSAAWAYVGSANCSESAWGIMTKDRLSKSPRLTCRNWECGVIIPVRKAPIGPARGNANDTGEVCGMKIFDGIVPIPMKIPGQRYGNRKPWSSQQNKSKDVSRSALQSSDEET